MAWIAKNGDRCEVPPEQLVQSEYMRLGYEMRIITDGRARNGQRFNSQRVKKQRKRERLTFAEVIGSA